MICSKVCSKCGVGKQIEEYSKCSKHADGLAYTCKSCSKEYNIKYRKQNKEKLFRLRQNYEKLKRSDNPILKRDQNKIDAKKYREYCIKNKSSIIKQCNKCLIEKTLDQFDVGSKEKDGFQYVCIQCNRKWAKKYRIENFEKEILRHKKYDLMNSNQVLKRQKNYRHKNREKCRERTRKYDRLNTDKRNYRAAKRRAVMRHAFVSWGKQSKISEYYKMAKYLSITTGIQYHVDHIIPLKNDYVCGLHNEFNLQIITSFNNLSKHNNFVPG